MGNTLPHVGGGFATLCGARGAPGHAGEPVGDWGGVWSDRIDGDSWGWSPRGVSDEVVLSSNSGCLIGTMPRWDTVAVVAFWGAPGHTGAGAVAAGAVVDITNAVKIYFIDRLITPNILFFQFLYIVIITYIHEYT